jgi:hypothetical protein
VNASAKTARSTGSAGEHLVDGLDPYACEDCLTLGDACVFHVGFAEGWDSAMAHVTRWATGLDD